MYVSFASGRTCQVCKVASEDLVADTACQMMARHSIRQTFYQEVEAVTTIQDPAIDPVLGNRSGTQRGLE